MTLEMTCRHCDITIRADTEADLVAQIQAHTLTHPHLRELTSEHILRRFHRRPRETRPTRSDEGP